MCTVATALRDDIYKMAGNISAKEVAAGGKSAAEEAEVKVTSDSEEASEQADPGQKESDEEIAEIATATSFSPFFPQGSCEATAREMLNYFGAAHDKSQKREVVDLAPGGGAMAFAACRDGFRYKGIVASQEHAEVLQASLILSIMKDLAVGKKDGYTHSRFLSKSRSLGSAIDEEKDKAQKTMDAFFKRPAQTDTSPGHPNAKPATGKVDPASSNLVPELAGAKAAKATKRKHDDDNSSFSDA